jgi:hypothetical protein
MTGEPLRREQVLNELQFLATVEHALIVEYLSVGCALGHDLEPEEGGATTTQGRDAASAASALAVSQMFHLRRVNLGLVDAGRSAQLERATSISSDSVAEITLSPPTLAQLQQLVDREEAIAKAVDERYARLVPAVTSVPVFEGELLEELRSVIVDDGSTHAGAVTFLRDSLGDLSPGDFLRATRRDPADTLERRLLDLSDRFYRLVLAALHERFAPSQDFFAAGTFRGFAVDAMDGLNDSIRVLVQRGLLPPFTLP